MQKTSWIWLKLFTPLLFVVIVLLLSRCGSNNSTPPSGTFANVYQVTLSKACIQCHVPGTSTFTPPTNVPLDFTTQTTAYNTIKNGKVQGGSSVGTCGGLAYVSTTINNSYLMATIFQSSLTGNNYAGKAGCTPYTGQHLGLNLTAAEQASFTTWIEAGAPNN